MTGPRAAKGRFPYPHPTIAEIDALSPAAPTLDARRHLAGGGVNRSAAGASLAASALDARSNHNGFVAQPGSQGHANG